MTYLFVTSVLLWFPTLWLLIGRAPEGRRFADGDLEDRVVVLLFAWVLAFVFALSWPVTAPMLLIYYAAHRWL